MAPAPGLRLLSRPGCHLCEEMASALDDLDLPYETVNIELDTSLEAAYGDQIPVLMLADRQIARAPQSARTLKRALQRTGVL
jgi:glutaredoxin